MINRNLKMIIFIVSLNKIDLNSCIIFYYFFFTIFLFYLSNTLIFLAKFYNFIEIANYFEVIKGLDYDKDDKDDKNVPEGNEPSKFDNN